MAGDAFLPSEIARLVLGYLRKTGCVKSFKTFLNECPHLKEYASHHHLGTVFPTNIGGKDLDHMLQEYGSLSIGLQKSELCNLQLYKKIDKLVQKLSSFEVSQSSRSPINVGADLYKDDTDSDAGLDTSPSCSLQVSSRNVHTPLLRTLPPNRTIRVNSGQSDSGISVGQRSSQAFGSSSPSLPSSNSSPCYDLPLVGNTTSNRSQASINAVHQWDITPISNISKTRKSRKQPSKTPTSTTSTVSTPINVDLPGFIGNDKITVLKLPRGNLNLPLLLNSLNSRPSETLQDDLPKEASTSIDGENIRLLDAHAADALQKEPDNLDNDEDDRDSVDTSKIDEMASQLPDFDQLDSPVCTTKATPTSTSQNLPLDTTPPNIFKTPAQPNVKDSPVFNMNKTPVKNFLNQEVKDNLKAASPRRKRQPPKRRSVDCSLTGRPRLSPVVTGVSELLVPANSNDSFMSQGSQGFVPKFEELCQNSKFAEKLAESINKATQLKFSTKTTTDDSSTDVQKQDDSKQDTGPVHKIKSENTEPVSQGRITSEELDQILMEEETINNIIDMTKNDPDFDALFNMFHVDKNEFIEKEYGVKSTDSTVSRNLSFANLLSSTTNCESSFQITQPETTDCSSVTAASTVISNMSAANASLSSLQSQSIAVSSGNTSQEHTIVQDASVLSALSNMSSATSCSVADSTSLISEEADPSLLQGPSDNTAVTPAKGNLVQLVYPSVDGKTSVFETVEVITVPADVQQTDAITQVANLDVQLSPGVTGQNDGPRTPSVDGEESLDEAGPSVMTPVVEPHKSEGDVTASVPDALNILDPILSPLLLSQALLLQMMKPKEDTPVTPKYHESPLLQSLGQLQQCMSASTTKDSLAQLQQALTAGVTAEGLPALANLQSKALEQLAQLVSNQNNPPPPTSQANPKCESDSSEPGAIDRISENSQSLPQPKRAKRTRRISSDEGTPARKSKLPKRVNKATSPAHSICSDKDDPVIILDDEEQEEKKVTCKTKKQGLNTVMHHKKPRNIKPWQIDTTKDKRKFLGVVWKSGSTKSETNPMEQVSESLLNHNYGPDEALPVVSEIKTPKSTKKASQKSSVSKTCEGPSLIHVTEASNSPIFGSTIDTSCLPLTSLPESGKKSASVLKNNNSLPKPTGKRQKAPLVRSLDFEPKKPPRKLGNKSTHSKKHVTFNMDENTPSKIQPAKDGTVESPSLSMPNNFEFVFTDDSLNISAQKCTQSKRTTSEQTKSDNTVPCKSETRTQSNLGKEETEIAETLITLAKAAVITPKKEVPTGESCTPSIQPSTAQSVSKKLFNDDNDDAKKVSTKLNIRIGRVVPRRQQQAKHPTEKLSSQAAQDETNVGKVPLVKDENKSLTQNLTGKLEELNDMTSSTQTRNDAGKMRPVSKGKKLEPKPKNEESMNASECSTFNTVKVENHTERDISTSNNVEIDSESSVQNQVSKYSSLKQSSEAAQTIHQKLDSITKSIQDASTLVTDVIPQWKSMDSPRTVISNSSIIRGSPSGPDMKHIRVASKPKAMAAREQEPHGNSSLCVDTNKNTNFEQNCISEPIVLKEKDSMSIEPSTSQLTSTDEKPKKSSKKTPDVNTVEQNNIMKTPVKLEHPKPGVRHTCSPKRRFTLNMLVEQSMKTLSKMDPTLKKKIESSGVTEKSCKKRPREVGSQEKGPKQKKSKKMIASPQIPVTNLSALNVEQLLSKMHK